ncbi:MAG: hypothetical protein K6F73_05930 [Lachnospiraceae bacterium]|nr:hypothetical protein [Lachnospiraceae bacterium]
MKKRIRKAAIIISLITAAIIAAVFFNRIAAGFVISNIILPDYSHPNDKTVSDEDSGIVITEKGRRLKVAKDGKVIWELPREVYAQDFLYEDIDHDQQKELLVLCWKRGRFGEHKPTWVKEDEESFSQHIFIYETDGKVVPKWMASDIGMDAKSWEFDDGVLSITDTDGEVTQWVWIYWGLEKI